MNIKDIIEKIRKHNDEDMANHIGDLTQPPQAVVDVATLLEIIDSHTNLTNQQ